MKELSLKLKIWRQKNQDDEGRFIEYDINGLNEHMSFLEMLDVLNERLISKGEEPIAFDPVSYTHLTLPTICSV